MKKKYCKPKLSQREIPLEETIANASALTKPQSASDVKREWDIDTDETKSFTWE